MSLKQYVRSTIKDGVAVLFIDNPPVNSLPGAAFGQIGDAIKQAAEDPEVSAIVLTGGGETFSAGFDLSSVEGLPGPDAMRKDNPKVYHMLDGMEDSPKPVVAAIKGVALGGGLEVAMGCHYRVAADNASVGLPEVLVGLLPGGAGTQRLPRLVGLPDALTIICQGQSIKADRALAIGLVDQIFPAASLLDDAIRFAKDKAKSGGPYPKARERSDKLPDAAAAKTIFQYAKGEVEKKAGKMIAPRKALECIEAGVLLGYEKGLQKELDNFIDCAFSDQADGLIHFFFAQRATTRIPELKDVKPNKKIQKVGVVGGGTMGRDIAFVHLISGKAVTLLEANQERLDSAADVIRGHFKRRVEQGRMSQIKMDDAVARFKPTLRYEDFADADLVIEAVFEKMTVKKEVFEKLHPVVGPTTILASNTSTLPIAELASVVTDPSRMIGLHYFSPARVMPLLEIIRAKQTSRETIATCLQLAKETKKTPVLVGDCYGFLTNRISFAYGAEASALLDEGASVEQVDRALVEFGLPMGPFTMGDMAGNDIGHHAAPGMLKAYPKRARKPSLIGQRMFDAGRHGQKTGKGHYRYDAGAKHGIADPEFNALVADARKEMGVVPRTDFTDEEIVERVIYIWINSAAECLEEDIALKPGDVDVATVMGFGFPAWRGGLMHYASKVGYGKIVAALEKYAKKYGPAYEPCQWLRDQAGKES